MPPACFPGLYISIIKFDTPAELALHFHAFHVVMRHGNGKILVFELNLKIKVTK